MVTAAINPSTHHRSIEAGAKVTVRKAVKMAKASKSIGFFIASNQRLGASGATDTIIAEQVYPNNLATNASQVISQAIN
jgi:hypothetical protein